MTTDSATATATVVIAAFTVVLAVVGGVQAWLTRKTINLARDEFISTHRPKIAIHSIWLMLDMIDQSTDDATIRAEIIYFNVGATPARVVDITAKISRRPVPLQTGITTWATHEVPQEPIVGGGKGYISVKSDIRINHEKVMQQAEATPRHAVVCMGKIIYEDDLGVRRETGFCRQLDAVAERWYNPADVRPSNSEYEYAY